MQRSNRRTCRITSVVPPFEGDDENPASEDASGVTHGLLPTCLFSSTLREAPPTVASDDDSKLACVTLLPRPRAVMWDLDGTVIDSEEYWIVAESEIARRFGVEWTHEDGVAMIGNGLDDTAAYMQRLGVDLPADILINEMSDRVIEQIGAAVPWRPGAPELMQSLHAAGVKQGIATMALTKMATLVAAAVPGVVFDAIVAGDQVTRSKPDPEVYLLAAERMSVSAPECVAIEDSPLGVGAAVNSGAITIGVPMILDLSDSGAHVVWDTLAGRNADDVARVFAEHRVDS